ncbi:MAG: hypothetical protein KF803_17105 [Cyclobacteriaceae bacterium]|nr:hypothetical protein [Cyclobacteriaceae bacterium]
MGNSSLTIFDFFTTYFIGICLVFFSVSLTAQDLPEPRSRSTIIDDSTKQIYGPTTSQYFLESDLFRNKWISYPIDTVIRNFHHFSFSQRRQNLHQDLGNIGTAIRPVYQEVPDVIGATSDQRLRSVLN